MAVTTNMGAGDWRKNCTAASKRCARREVRPRALFQSARLLGLPLTQRLGQPQRPVGEHPGDLLRRHRPREVEALDEVAPQPGQLGNLLRGLGALAHNPQ